MGMVLTKGLGRTVIYNERRWAAAVMGWASRLGMKVVVLGGCTSKHARGAGGLTVGQQEVACCTQVQVRVLVCVPRGVVTLIPSFLVGRSVGGWVRRRPMLRMLSPSLHLPQP